MNNFSNQMQMGDFNNNLNNPNPNPNNNNNNNYPSQNQNQNQYNPGTSNNQIGYGNANTNVNMDTISLNSNDYNGTSLNDLSGDNKYEDNNSLIKSLTKEIMNNLKENNIDIYDNLTSRKYDDSDSESSGKKKKKKKKHKKDKDRDRDLDLDYDLDYEPIKEELQDYVLDSNPVPASNGYLSWLFDSGFDYKDFLILFILYFILSQEMIKDFFAKYFNCLNPDDEGKINIQGVIVYGLILTIFFMLVKKFF